MNSQDVIGVLCMAVASAFWGCAARAPGAGLPNLTNQNVCEYACKNLDALECPEARPTRAGRSCAQMCTRLAAAMVSEFDAECTAKATSKTTVRVCGVRCGKE
jgi:hypothetical protein